MKCLQQEQNTNHKRVERKTHEVIRSGVDRFGGYGEKISKIHTKEHPIQQIYLSEFRRRAVGS